MSNFTHLHVHSENSLLDGLSKIKKLVTRAKDHGQSALAITDHGALYGRRKSLRQKETRRFSSLTPCPKQRRLRKPDADRHHWPNRRLLLQTPYRQRSS